MGKMENVCTKMKSLYMRNIKEKVKLHPRTGHEGPQGEQRYSSTRPSTLVLDGGGWSEPRPGRFTPREKTRYPLYRRLSGAQGRSGRARKISHPPPTFHPRTVQPLASHYTDCAIPAPYMRSIQVRIFNSILTGIMAGLQII